MLHSTANERGGWTMRNHCPPAAPVVVASYYRFEDEWILDDPDGHRIPNPDHPYGRWPTALSVVMELEKLIDAL